MASFVVESRPQILEIATIESIGKRSLYRLKKWTSTHIRF